jgi:hypothetical protein
MLRSQPARVLVDVSLAALAGLLLLHLLEGHDVLALLLEHQAVDLMLDLLLDLPDVYLLQLLFKLVKSNSFLDFPFFVRRVVLGDATGCSKLRFSLFFELEHLLFLNFRNVFEEHQTEGEGI